MDPIFDNPSEVIEDKVEKPVVETEPVVELEVEEEKPEPQEVLTRGFSSKEDIQEDDEDLELDPTEAKSIDKHLKKHLSPLEERLQRQEHELEVSNFLLENPEYKKHKDTILKYVSHKAYKDVPVSFIAAGLASKDLLKMGAERERQAQVEAEKTKNTGGSVRTDAPQARNWMTASKGDFEAQRAKILNRQGY